MAVDALTNMPTTPLGRMLAETLGGLGPLLLVVPLLIVHAEHGRLRQVAVRAANRRIVRCTRCEAFDHAADARFCKACGTLLPSGDENSRQSDGMPLAAARRIGLR